MQDGLELPLPGLDLLELSPGVALEEAEGFIGGLLDRLPVRIGQFRIELLVGELLLGLVADLLERVALGDGLLEELVLSLVELGLLDHRLDLLLVEPLRVVLDLDGLALPF